VAASASEVQADANRKGTILKTIFQYDVLYWTASKLFKKQLLGIIGATDEVIAGLTPDQQVNADHFIEYMNPASPRAVGAVFDNEATMPGGRIAAITAPTLIIHAEDDLLQLYHNAEFAAATIPESEIMSYESGGHILMIVQQEAIKNAVRENIIENENIQNSIN
jgi:pimeloyl-ACP methyl ester carboxylesterase